MSNVDNWSIDNCFPSIVDVDWAVVLYHPGLESDLLSSFIVERYGINRVLWVGLAPLSTDPQSYTYNFVENINTRFNGIHKLVINLRDLERQSNSASVPGIESAKFNFWSKVYNYLKAYGEVDIERVKTFTGVNRVNKALIDLNYSALEDSNYGGDISRYLEDHTELDAVALQQEYSGLIKDTDFTGNIADTLLYNITDKTSIVRAIHEFMQNGIHPFESLVYNEVCQLALKCNKEDMLINSWNCEVSMKNVHPRCGICQGCKQFKSGLSFVDKLKDVEFAE